MTIDPLLLMCPICNILSQIYVADMPYLIQTLGRKGGAAYEELRCDLPDSPLSTSLNILKEDRIIVEGDKQYALSNIGKELFPLISALIAWCERNVSPSLRQQSKQGVTLYLVTFQALIKRKGVKENIVSSIPYSLYVALLEAGVAIAGMFYN